MSVSFSLRALAAFCFDGSLAVATGVLLASAWLGPSSWLAPSKEHRWPAAPIHLMPALRLSAVVFLLASCSHLYLLTGDFTGQTKLLACLGEIPGMLHTHAGLMDALLILVALLLCSAALLGRRLDYRLDRRLDYRLDRYRVEPALLCASLVSVSLLLHADTGHAAVQGNLTIDVLLQALHLGAMAVWSGGVLVSGLLVLPAWPFAAPFDITELRGYMSRLSLASTWAVALVFATGVLKSYRTVGGELHTLLSGAWSYVLMAKVVLVVIALALGGLNRLWLGSAKPWDEAAVRRSGRALRLEAWCMLLVLALSAALGNLDPPGDAS